MLRKIYFYDDLAKSFGHETLELQVSTPFEALSALKVLLPAFEEKSSTLKIAILAKDADGIREIPLNEYVSELSPGTDLVLVSEFSGNLEFVAANVFNTTLAAASAATTVAIVATYIVINVAISYAISAIAQALAPTPQSSGPGGSEGEGSFAWQGIQNNVGQGYSIPLVFGTCYVGSTVVSTDVVVDEIRLSTPTPATSPGAETYQPGAELESY